MIYYRSKEDAKKLVRDRIERFRALWQKSQDLYEIADFFMESHVVDPHDDLQRLGMLERVFSDGIQVAQLANSELERFKVEPRLLDEMAENGIAVDALMEGNRVALYGRLQQGMLVEVVALNLHNLPGPNQL